MIRAVFVHVVAFALTITSFALADARGENPDLNGAFDMVLCTGTGMTTITLGPDGEPIESVHLCPDGTSIFAASFALPSLNKPEIRVIARIVPSRAVALAGRVELSPSARGPPALV
ncbi:hypothetical protein SAMN04488030_2209 [Aliiroseovarius halocynthiae]|uniref:DUF2946 domain-containing protein n=1 Tax=Aliiroseovarius halocynthiae TaxID=985055 RepID=A0A545SXR1_9RHOB|nr:hypothetical protein [Aliiroseovarius halocynthiae]TQV69755.1 hypothetical protein FIL88_01405 [Aliiroseovarius halocynthiae]SMR81787.1 hypothetical protein SAMN04488030_2209 [Aliiroseovarius halocynthiae]